MRSVCFLLLSMLSCVAIPARASTTTVPDNFATIQAAINGGADTVYVKGGTYNESVAITHAVCLTYDDRQYVLRIPIVTRILMPAQVSGTVTVRGFHITGGATVRASSVAEFVFCRADSGVYAASTGYARAMGCVISGALGLQGLHSVALFNSVSGGGVAAYADALSLVSENSVQGPAAIGIDAGSEVEAVDNLVRNCTVGMRIGCDNGGASQNRVEDCASNGIVSVTGGTCGNGVYYTGNTVRRCGGGGIVVSGVSPIVTDNTVDSTAGMGIQIAGMSGPVTGNRVTRAGSHGISVGSLMQGMSRNTVLHCAGDGIVVNYAHGAIHHNVVGANFGRGIAAIDQGSVVVVRSNTSYGNSSYGIDVSTMGSDVDSVSFNIGYGNSYGLHVSGTGTTPLACNDWYGNSSGATSGVAMGASDFALNPLFCNRAADVVSLASTSPALNRAGCGLVGALGLGCTTPVSVPPAGGSMGDARLRAFPQPNHGALRFAWVPQGGPTRLEVYDVHGALRYTRALGAGESGLEWSRTDAAGQALPAGVYFARLRDDTGERSACRVVLLH